jgi:hypothetical protein
VVAVVVAIAIAVPVSVTLSVPVSIPISFVVAVGLLAFISHWLTLEIVGIGADRADVVLIVIALVGTHAFPVIFLFARVFSLIACFRELLAGTGEMIVRAGVIPLS